MGRVLLVAASAIVACLLVPLTATGARPLRTALVDPWTFNVETPQSAFQRAKGTGASFIKIYVNWNAVAPSQPLDPTNPADAEYRWAATTRQVEGALNEGLTPFLYVADAPLWARSGGNRPRPIHLSNFYTALARQYLDVRHFQVWNEPNLTAFLTPQRSGRRIVSAPWYKRMVNAVAAAVEGVNTNNVVIAGGTGPLGKRGTAPLAFMRKMLCLRKNLSVIRSCAPARFDVWAHHPYTSGGPTHDAFAADDVSLGDLKQMRRVLMAAARRGKIRKSGDTANRSPAFWVTEFSWDTKPPDPKGVPSGLHARWVSEALYRMWQARVSLVTWFKLDDELRSAPDRRCFYQSGFYRAGHRVKPSLRAFRFPFVAFASKKGRRVSFWGRTPESTAAKVVVQRRTARGWRRVATVRANHVGIFAKTLRRPWKTGSLRATIARPRQISRPFSLRQPRDRRVSPFGAATC